jgi:hypothetical protein
MNSKMQVLLVKQTRHVLAAFTRTSDPEGIPSVEETFHAGLAIRNREVVSGVASPSGGEKLVVPWEILEVAVVDMNSDVFRSPLRFVSGGGQVVEAGINPIIFQPGPLPSPPPATPLLAANSPEVKFSSTRATIVLNGNTTEDKNVCLVIQETNPSADDAPERRFAQGVIKSGEHYASLDWKTSPGGATAPILHVTSIFNILALVQGFSPTFGAKAPV